MSDCRFGVSPVNYPDPDPDPALFMPCFFVVVLIFKLFLGQILIKLLRII